PRREEARRSALRIIALRLLHRRLPGAHRSAPPASRLARGAGRTRSGSVAQACGLADRRLGAGAAAGVPDGRQAGTAAGSSAAKSLDPAARASAVASEELPRAMEDTCP